MHIWVPPVIADELRSTLPEDPTPSMIERVQRAREIQQARNGSGLKLNSMLGIGELKRVCVLDRGGEQQLGDAVQKHRLSARGYARVLRVARSIADLDGSEVVKASHINETLSYRPMKAA